MSKKGAKFKERCKRFNITEESLNQLYKDQNYCCKLCGRPESSFSKSLAVDHCHKTGRVRGLLCYRCNYTLGVIENMSFDLSKVEDYLTSELIYEKIDENKCTKGNLVNKNSLSKVEWEKIDKALKPIILKHFEFSPGDYILKSDFDAYVNTNQIFRNNKPIRPSDVSKVIKEAKYQSIKNPDTKKVERGIKNVRIKTQG